MFLVDNIFVATNWLFDYCMSMSMYALRWVSLDPNEIQYIYLQTKYSIARYCIYTYIFWFLFNEYLLLFCYIQFVM